MDLPTCTRCGHEGPLAPRHRVCPDCKRKMNRAAVARYRATAKGTATRERDAAKPRTPEQLARHAAQERQRIADPVVAEAKRAREREKYATDAEYREARRVAQHGRPSSGKPGKSSDAQRKARQRVADALRWGRMTKPTTCGQCARACSSRRLHAHHADYSKPLEVQWLCVDCHMVTHRKYP